MITNDNYLNVAQQIAKAFCNNNSVCESATYERLKTTLDNDTFSFLLNRLNNGGLYEITIIALGAPNTRTGKQYMKWSWLDVIRGTSANYEGNYPINQLKTFQNFAQSIIGGANFVKEMPKKNNMPIIIVHNPTIAGYGIALTTEPTATGGTTGTGTGKIEPVRNEYGEVIPSVTTVTPSNGFDLQSLLIPGLLVAGIFLVMKK